MTTIVKPNIFNFAHLWRSFNQIRRQTRRDTEVLDMTRVHSYTSHSYTSLRDVVACSLPAASSKQCNSQLNCLQSVSDIRHVHMRNPLLEKAARAYLATAKHTQPARMNSFGSMSSSFSSFLKIIWFPFNSVFKRRIDLV